MSIGYSKNYCNLRRQEIFNSDSYRRSELCIVINVSSMTRWKVNHKRAQLSTKSILLYIIAITNMSDESAIEIVSIELERAASWSVALTRVQVTCRTMLEPVSFSTTAASLLVRFFLCLGVQSNLLVYNMWDLFVGALHLHMTTWDRHERYFLSNSMHTKACIHCEQHIRIVPG